MKITLWAIGFLAVLFAGLVARSMATERASATASLIQNPTVFKISIALPQESLELDDLDARDEFNRPIKTAAVRISFANLWARSLNQTILNSLTPLKLQMLALLNSKWNGFCGAVRRTAQTTSRSVKVWFDSKKINLKILVRVTSSISMSPPTHSMVYSDNSAFLYFLSCVISSTRLLR